jgi:hypothetical protein
VTDSRRDDAEAKIKDAEDRYRALLEAAPDAMVIVAADGRIALVNGQTERLFGYMRDEMLGRPVEMLIPEALRARHVERRAEFHENPRTRPMSGGVSLLARTKSGAEIPVEISLSPFRTSEGLFAIATIRDIGERKRAEAALQRAEEQLRQAHKMEAIGSLAGGIAHDFNNLLSVILSYASLVLDELKPGDPIRGDIEQMRTAGERGARLTQQLLAFGRQQMLAPKILDLTQVVDGIEGMLRRLLGEDVEVSLLTTRGLGKVVADPGQIEQILINLAVNARDAMPEGGKLTIETANVQLDEAYAAEHLGVVPGPYVMLAVTDTGVGMDAATRERVFEPFFTTKAKGKGTGLGLSTVFGIVKQSGGHIWIYSEPGEGTTFKVYLPRTDQTATAPEAPSPPPPTDLRGSETVLLVEDEEQVRVLGCAILRRSGYNVLEAQNGGEALLICEQYKGKIHLLLTDVVMPLMSGRQLAERLAPLRPDMKVLYTSGYTDTAIVHHGVLDAGIAFLQKPITPGSLLRRVREVLDARLPRASIPSP